MSRQTKTRRRLLSLLGGTLAVTALAGGGALFRLHFISQRALQGRTDGLASMARADYASALTQLGKYLSRNPNDAEILLPYAKARRQVEEPDGRHLGQAIGLFQRVLELRPGQSEAQTNLLELYFQVGYNTEAIGLADSIVKKSPSDTGALRIKILSLIRMQRLEEAETNVRHLTETAPLDLEFHILEIQIMLNRGHQALVEEYADRLAKAHPDDVRFVLLKSIAASLAGDPKSAAMLVHSLVALPQADSAYTRMLVRQLDSLELFGDAFTVLQRAVKGNSDREIAQLWLRRLFETNRFQMLLDEASAVAPNAANLDVEILAMRVLALVRLDRRPEATELLASIEKRGHDDPSAARWAAALHALVRTDAADPIQSVRLLRDALRASPQNPILLQELGDAYAAAGAHDKASVSWNDAARAAPAWSVPLVRLSKTLVAGGRAADGLAAAKAAQQRSPDDREALMSVAVASAASLPEGSSADAVPVLSLIADIQRRFPADADTISLQVAVLAQSSQRDAAVAQIRAALDARPVVPQRLLLALAEMSESFKLEQTESCFAAYEKAYGLTSDLAFARARWYLAHQRGPEGLALLEQARSAHPADDMTWRNVWATYLDMLGDPRAASAWIALGDENPENARIQWAALSARCVQGDHTFMGKTIDRLVSLLGDDGLSMTIVRARWYLQGDSKEDDVTKASILLSNITRNAPDMVAPRLLLATCSMRLGNVSGAIDQLVAVSDMQPDQAEIALELARLLQSRGDISRARNYIDRAVRSKLITIQNRRLAASLLALQGDYPRALDILEKAYAAPDQQPPDLVLAALYRQLNQPQKTADICQSLLEKPDGPTIAFCADFYASQGRLDDAQRALTLLDGIHLAPGAKELVLADYATRYGTSDEALKQFQAAAIAAPSEPAVWQQLVAYCFGIGKIDEALDAADRATKKLASPAGFEVLHQNAVLVRDAAKVSGTRQLLMMLAGGNASNEPILDALGIIVTAQQQKEPPRSTATKLRQLADKNQRVLALQTITLQFYMDAGQVNEAVALASRAVQSFPAAVEPMRLATGVLGAAQQWDQALGTAKEWRRLGGGEPLDADLAIASAELHLSNPTAASQQIQPYLERAIQDPEKFSGIILVRAQGLLAAHQPGQVEDLLGPLLTKSVKWRGLWLTLAVQGVDDANRAQAWLERVTPLMSGNPVEGTALADAWIDLGKRWSNGQFDQIGRKLLAAIVQSPDAPAVSLLTWGTLCEGSSDWVGAEHAYREVLTRKPDDTQAAIARNDLANVLMKQRRNLDEARQLITQALSVLPNVPAFLDTKAAVQAALKDYAGAISSLKDAQRLDPSNLAWHVNLVDVLIDAGQTPAARAEMQQISTSLAASPKIAPELRERYDALRARLQ